MIDILAAAMEDIVTDRLRDDLPSSAGFIVIAALPDADALPEAWMTLAPANG